MQVYNIIQYIIDHFILLLYVVWELEVAIYVGVTFLVRSESIITIIKEQIKRSTFFGLAFQAVFILPGTIIICVLFVVPIEILVFFVGKMKKLIYKH